MSEQRSGEDRRDSSISHMTLYEKQLQHDDDIIDIKSDLKSVKADVHLISQELEPISKGITSMVFLFKIALSIGALAAAGVGVIEFMEAYNNMGGG